MSYPKIIKEAALEKMFKKAHLIQINIQKDKKYLI